MGELSFIGFIGGLFYLGFVVGAINNEDYLDKKTIEKATEICINANSKVAKISSSTVICENGGEFKYESKN